MKKFFYIIILFLLLSNMSVFAKEYELGKNRIYNIHGVSIELVSIGNSGSIYLSINGQRKLIEFDDTLTLYDLNITNLESDISYQKAKVDIILASECLIDKDCEDLKPQPCMSATCDYRTCEFEAIEGCPIENECKSVGSFEEVDNVLSYCAVDFEWKPRKSYKEECNYNYECLSNKCNGKCSTFISGGKKMAPAWILIVIGGILLIESLFILLRPNMAKRIIKNSAFWRRETWRVIAVIEIIIALALIIWALI